MSTSNHQHDYRFVGLNCYMSPIGAQSKMVYECSCGQQKFSAPVKGEWEVEDFDVTVPDGEQVNWRGKHKHSFYNVATYQYDSLGGPRTHILQRCSCGQRTVSTYKGHGKFSLVDRHTTVNG